jgi:uridine kinase
VTVVRFVDLARRVLAEPPRLGPVRLVAVDGPAGSGKTTFAGRLGNAFRGTGSRVAEIGVDDLLDGWAGMHTWWPSLRRDVLAPLRAGTPGRYRRYDWAAGRFADDRVHVAVPDVLLLEGVSSARMELAAEVTYAVWAAVDDPAVRLARMVRRDGAALTPYLRGWMTEEAAHFAADRTADRADLRVDGASPVPHDPTTEFVAVQLATTDGVDGVARLEDHPGWSRQPPDRGSVR